MLPTFSNQQADLCVGELLHSVALPRHQPQDAHEGPHVAYAPRFLLQLLPLCCLVDAGEDVCVGITQCTEQRLASGIFPNHLKQETEAMQEVEGAVFISVQGALCACETYAPGGLTRTPRAASLLFWEAREITLLWNNMFASNELQWQVIVHKIKNYPGRFWTFSRIPCELRTIGKTFNLLIILTASKSIIT